MVLCATFGLYAVAAVISSIIDWLLGLDYDGMQYDWRAEKWIFVPTRYDVVLELMIKG